MVKTNLIELRKIIRQSIKDVIMENQDIFRLRPLDENYIMENLMCEGLIMTYPTMKILPMLKRKFRLSDSDIQLIKDKREVDREVSRLIIKINDSWDNEIMDNLTDFMERCGYHRSTTPEMEKKTPWVGFEPNYPVEIQDMLRVNNINYIYHLTKAKNLYGIRKKGLQPRSESNLFSYRDRVYFVVGDELDASDIYMLRTLKLTKSKDDVGYQSEQWVLLKIAVDKISENITFYQDPMMNNAIFTYDVINPEAIKEVIPFN